MDHLDQPLKNKHFCKGAIAIEKEKCRINLNKPICIGTRILDLVKVLMQDFQYSYIKSKHGDKAEMLLTDTDSLTYKVEAENVYEYSAKIKSYLNSVITQNIQNITIMQMT